MPLPLRPALILACVLALAGGAHAQSPEDIPAQTQEVVPAAPPATEPSAEEPEPGPPPPLPNLSEPNSRTGEAASEPSARSPIPKSLRSSGSSAGGPANDLNPGGIPEEPVAPRGALPNVLLGRELFHGNYCGAGQRGENLPPIDALDAACMRHDACYDAAGHRSCACDRTLKREAANVSERPDVALEVRRRALLVVEAAEGMGCTAP